MYNINRIARKVQKALINHPRLYNVARTFWKKFLSRGDRFPSSVMVAISNVCNLNCPMCQPNSEKSPKLFMSFPLFKKIIDQCYQNGVAAVSLHNVNEPILHPEILDMLFYLEEMGVEVDVSTNGQALDTFIEKMEKNPRKLKKLHLRYSIDGGNKATYEICRYPANFEKLLTNVRNVTQFCKKYGIKLTQTVNYVLSKISIQSLGSFYANFSPFIDIKKNSFCFLTAGWMEEYGFIKDNIIIPMAPRQTCGVISGGLSVLPNGNVSFCCGDKTMSQTVVGNINDKTLSDIYFSEGYIKLRSESANNNLQSELFPEICRNCKEHTPGKEATLILQTISDYYAEMKNDSECSPKMEEYDARIYSAIEAIYAKHQIKHKRVAFITDSLAMPREKDFGDIPEEKTYPSIVKSYFGDKINISLFLRRARTMDEVAVLIRNLQDYDIVFVHVGVVDCYPRIFSKQDGEYFSKISGVIREELQKYIHDNRAKIIKSIGNLVYTQLGDFKKYLFGIVKIAERNNNILIVANIISAKQNTPFINENIDEYNRAILKAVHGSEQILFDANRIAKENGGYEEMLLSDNHHLSIKGNKIFAGNLIAKIEEILKI